MTPLTQILTGDCRDLLRSLPENSVDCCITSPPFYGLRDYQLPPSVWGGDPACDHEWSTEAFYREGGATTGSKERFTPPGPANAARLKATRWREETVCLSCGAWLGCLGLERDPDQYIAHLTEVFAGVWRVLKPTGTCWINISDSYAGSWGNYGARIGKQRPRTCEHWERPGYRLYSQRPPTARIAGIRDKSLILIPQRLALSLQQAGWIVRSEVIWHKPNACPESVKDRPTRAHETVLMVTREERYFYDREAVLEPFVTSERERYAERAKVTGRGNQASAQAALGGRKQDKSGGYPTSSGGRNKRSVWSVHVRPGPRGHHATYPPDLVRPMILAGCPVSGTVLDPFAGSGTTLLVARELGRNAIGIELSAEYASLATDRLSLNP